MKGDSTQVKARAAQTAEASAGRGGGKRVEEGRGSEQSRCGLQLHRILQVRGEVIVASFDPRIKTQHSYLNRQHGAFFRKNWEPRSKFCRQTARRNRQNKQLMTELFLWQYFQCIRSHSLLVTRRCCVHVNTARESKKVQSMFTFTAASSTRLTDLKHVYFHNKLAL